MRSRLIALGEFSFEYRGSLLLIAVILLIVPSPRLFADPALAGLIGFLVGRFLRSPVRERCVPTNSTRRSLLTRFAQGGCGAT